MSFLIFQLSEVGVGHISQQTSSQWFICWGEILFFGFIWILVWFSFSTSSFCSLKVFCNVSLFPSWLSGYLLSCTYICHNNQGKHKTEPYLFNWKNVWALIETILLLVVTYNRWKCLSKNFQLTNYFYFWLTFQSRSFYLFLFQSFSTYIG